ncbi:putative leucine permease transcriptional regulator [Golovinomyces cichoracearum]|uniref:Putative leucine permease transcriptional regulator n=1 Tax=Golovinomyces cichoracearum TaxID=62708 RepID=A0A420I3W5_9PEZI|nr:putative leucine permease transcriptional regulator [Golovinomyces cichoracearum]
MSTSLFGTTNSTQNPFAVGNSKSAPPLSSFNFTQAPSTFGAPSGPISNVFSSKKVSSSPPVWPNAGSGNPGITGTSFPSLSAGPSSFNNTTLGGPLNLIQTSFEPHKISANTSVINSASNTKASSQKNIFGAPTATNKSHLTRETCQDSTSEFESGSILNSASISNSVQKNDESSKTFAEKIQAQLLREGISPPSLATLDYTKEPSDFIQAASELRLEFLKYRETVRASLIKVNLLDDPNVPKKLKDAIDFKGTCNEMCPEYECLTRMVDRRYDKTERDINPDGSLAAQPNPEKMVKALARSAAGQDAPLPSDIRTAAALKRTVDYLFNTVLAERDLVSVHGFLWDRTRAVRRDFVFHSSMTPTELSDQVYCLERIIRFHAISLHHMSKDGIPAEGFSDQQEREQLSKSLLSLIHAYEDCRLQGVYCENEIEFKAYYILFNGEIPGIMETVQNWGWEVWENSEIIKIAVSLSESLQNTWDFHGPLFPVSTMEISQNAYSRFFSIVEDPSVSYTMACFAEVYFNKIRKAILRTILYSYRKQRGQTKDWTLEKLNKYLRFDNASEVEPFVELYGLHFSETDKEWCLSFESVSTIQDPHPLPKQPHSHYLVESKRGKHSLSEAINGSIHEAKIPSSRIRSQSLFEPDSINGGQPASSQDLLPKSDSQESTKKIDYALTSCNVPFSKHNFTETDKSSLKLTTTPDIDSKPKFFNFMSNPVANIKDAPATSLPLSDQKIFNQLQTPLESKSNFKLPQNTLTFEFHKPISMESPDPKNSLGSLSQETRLSGDQARDSDIFPAENRSLAIKKNETSRSNFVHPSNKIPVNSHAVAFEVEENKIASVLLEPQRKPSKLVTESSSENSNGISLLKSSPADGNDLKHLSPSILNSSQKREIEGKKRKQGQSRLEKLTHWIFEGDDGLLEQFSEIQASKIIHDVFTNFMTNQLIKSQEEADKKARSMADQFRVKSLSVKYGYLWREQARRLRLKRKGREARQARLELAKYLKHKKDAISSSLVEDFRASTNLRRRQRDRNSMEAYDFNRENDTETKSKRQIHKRRRSERSLNSEYLSPDRQHASTSMNVHQNRSLLSDPSYLSGQSRMHLLPYHFGSDEKKISVSGVRSDYFRLKARGIETPIDNINYNTDSKLVDYGAQDTERVSYLTKGITKTWGDRADFKATNKKQVIEAPNKDHDPESEPSNSETSEHINFNTDKYRGKNIEDDSVLFERAKRIREQMDEGADWFRSQFERGDFEI